jgi:hypothetical protein
MMREHPEHIKEAQEREKFLSNSGSEGEHVFVKSARKRK